ncbi:MAG: hypothetical protein ABI222_03215 [Opitutaceae bacterium]
MAVIQLAGLDRQGQGTANLGPSSIGPTDPDVIVDLIIRSRFPNPHQDTVE